MGMTFLTAQMNADLLPDDLKKKRTSNQSFWLVGRPDVEIRKAPPSSAGVSPPSSSPQYIAEVRAFDYYNTRPGTTQSVHTHTIPLSLPATHHHTPPPYP